MNASMSHAFQMISLCIKKKTMATIVFKTNIASMIIKNPNSAPESGGIPNASNSISNNSIIVILTNNVRIGYFELAIT